MNHGNSSGKRRKHLHWRSLALAGAILLASGCGPVPPPYELGTATSTGTSYCTALLRFAHTSAAATTTIYLICVCLAVILGFLASQLNNDPAEKTLLKKNRSTFLFVGAATAGILGAYFHSRADAASKAAADVDSALAVGRDWTKYKLCLAAASWLPNVGSVWRLQGENLVGAGYRWQDNLLPGGVGADAVLAGHLNLALAAIAVLLVLAAATASRESRLLAGAGLVALALATPLLGWLYGRVPGLAFLQFPWRWLGVAGCIGLMTLAGGNRKVVRVVGLVAFVLPLAVPVAFRWRLADGPPMRPSDPGPVVARAAARFGVPPILP